MSLTTKWRNPIWDPNMLNSGNILNYFCDRSNPFYNNQCNNEKVMMQKLSIDITQLIGDEYCLYDAQDPILFIICKQRRKSPHLTIPLAFYYIVNGEIMQAPDLASVINARLQTSLYHLNESFQTLLGHVLHHPSTGSYTWTEDDAARTRRTDSVEDRQRNFGNQFHTTNMSLLMGDWLEQFPPQQPVQSFHPQQHHHQQSQQMNPPPIALPGGRNTNQTTPSVGSSTPRSAAVGPSDSTTQPPFKKMRM